MAGTRDLDRLGGLKSAMPWTAATAGIAALSLMGLPPVMGFVAKEYSSSWDRWTVVGDGINCAGGRVVPVRRLP